MKISQGAKYFLRQSRKLGPAEVRKALKALGFKVKRDQVRELVNDASIKGNGYVYLVKISRISLFPELQLYESTLFFPLFSISQIFTCL